MTSIQAFIQRLALLLPLLLVMAQAQAHPGAHAELSGWALLSHIVSNPLHLGIVTGVILLAVASVAVWGKGQPPGDKPEVRHE